MRRGEENESSSDSLSHFLFRLFSFPNEILLSNECECCGTLASNVTEIRCPRMHSHLLCVTTLQINFTIWINLVGLILPLKAFVVFRPLKLIRGFEALGIPHTEKKGRKTSDFLTRFVKGEIIVATRPEF